MTKIKKGYMCSIDFDWELGEAMGGSTIYPSVEDLKEHHVPWESCGIVEVEITRTNIVHKEDLRRGAISGEEFARQEKQLRVKWYKEAIKNLEAELENKKERLNNLEKELK